MSENKNKKPISENLTPKHASEKKSTPKPATQKVTSATPKRESTAPAKNKRTSTPKKTAEPVSGTNHTPSAATKAQKPLLDENSLLFQLCPYLLGFLGVLSAFFIGFPNNTGFFGTITLFLRGLLSYAVWAIPLFLFFGAFKLKEDIRRSRVGQKFVFSLVCIVFLSVLVAVSFLNDNKTESFSQFFGNFSEYFAAAKQYKNGGVIGGFFGWLLYKATGSAAIVIASFIVLIFGMFEFGCTPEDIIAYTRDKIRAKCHDIRNKPHERKYTPAPAPAEHASYHEPIDPTSTERKHTVYHCNRDMAYHLTRKKVDIDIDIDDRKPKKQSIFETLHTDELREQEKQRVDSENKENALRDSENLAIGADLPTFEAGDTEKAERTIILPETPTAPQFKPDPAAFGSATSHDELSATVAPSTSSALVGNEKLDTIFADGAVIEAGGRAMNLSVLEQDAVLDPAKGSPVDSEVSDKERGIEIESGKLAVSPRPTLEELYNYPPVDLLKRDPNPTTFTVTDELKATAAKLVDTLANFGVRTKITNISCGPTVTRYELQPEVGVRVKSIQNLSDDIALHLAANGVRIEAPIPGKDAVGIEIPNKTVSTVYIRNLIEDSKFRTLKSRISVCLGMDVAGSPVYMDIAKMPHLLIAGATGMGKSVCINSFIISILYKARPDEVKFILIDPKKVEFSLYKGIPHLLVPVVNEPKKAAGALAWAVSEMERRFALIEEVGVRDISGYNNATKDDPEKPHMSQIVIIIDELADLMMTAKDEVENSICRLAQKARAAGMHIVIGTQRPSVDVITGLIKANIPSRIACTVASQVDSRTIIDISGAEKLIGKGDMLFAPVGCLKPIRVQGSFVSDGEVEAVTDYLRANCKAEYDASIIEDIEREAARCGEKKKGKSSDFGDAEGGSTGDPLADGDDMIMPAIGVAVSAGQLSTSLLQRKLSLGYARAARIVDTLEQMGIVSGYEGSKPRHVLISQEQYLEMKMRHEGGEE